MTHLSTPTPQGRLPLRAVQVLGGGSAGSSAHVRSLASGLVARGVQVTVCAPAGLEQTYDFTGAGARFVAVPRRSDPVSVAALRTETADADLVHAHGLDAGARTTLALTALRRPPGHRSPPLVVTWHNHRHAEGARARLQGLVERRVARSASVVFGTSSALVDRARSRGARDARLAPIAFPPPRRAPESERDQEPRDDDGGTGTGPKARAELGAVERPLLMAVGSLHPERGYGTLLDATRAWNSLDPVPLLVIAGEGPERAALQGRIDAESLPVRLAGRRDDVAELLAAADVAVLPSRWESRSLLAQEALHAGVPLVATAVGGVPELVGEAADLVPYGDAAALARAVTRLLADPERRASLRAKGLAQAATWPSEDDTVTQVLSVYDELARPSPL
ncbi:putative teichuronic acid biosynthesis glycosyltransferase TuaC [Streptomyces sp. YIM 130001]|uniref:glycosyltransferase family 4 protein n=1 Tax=Streptomyces sp. YIM 130001 TaxID=2259644 RepID=UPI000E656A90|nr:glycosyltransferase family 4 protein [Streptomyces sp. YIM 130001]RII18906.1 putative teichuronic acid biosynthesis glycosyltransferase TuaC [Streptomyces sp. YIM 130001]